MAYTDTSRYPRHHYSYPRHNAPPVYYGSPYAYPHDHSRYDLRPAYHENHIMIAEADQPDHLETNPRKRISVACGRCRRRKIRCSGDPGDDTGCNACRTAGSDIQSECSFNRVRSENLEFIPDVQPLRPSSSVGSTAIVPSTYPGSTTSAGRYSSQALRRPSLRTLQTRSSFPPDASSPFEASPVDAYTYASSTIPRQDSIPGVYGLENYRSWHPGSGSISAPMTTAYEPPTTCSFDAMPAPFMPQPQNTVSRLPSITAEPSSSLNMGHLNASLPLQMAHNRQLPIPPPSQGPQRTPFNSIVMPHIRPLQDGKSHINGVHSRNALPWCSDISLPPSTTSSVSTVWAQHHGLPTTSAQTTMGLSEPVLGYQFNLMPPPVTSIEESNVSSMSGQQLHEYYPATSGPSASMASYSEPRWSMSTTHGPATSAPEDPPILSRGSSTALYSTRSTESDLSEEYARDAWHSSGSDGSAQTPYAMTYAYRPHPNRSSADYGNEISGQTDNAVSYDSNALQHPRPQHAASVESLCGQQSFGHEPQAQHITSSHDDHDHRRHSSNTHTRMSISNFNE